MNKKKGVVRIDMGLSERIKKLLEKEDNKLYCSSLSNFVNVSVMEMLEKIESKKGRIRWVKDDV